MMIGDKPLRPSAAWLVLSKRWGGLERNVGSLRLWSLAAVLAATLLWLISLQSVNVGEMNEWGLISVLPLTYYAALAILLISAGVVTFQRQTPEWLGLLHLLVLVFILHGTPNILYGTLRYSWAWKHIGIVDYLQRYGRVEPEIAFLDAYHNWPGFFTLNTLLTEVAGFDSPLAYAGWAPVAFNLLNLGALRLILKSLTDDKRLVGLGLWFFCLANWVGQDYFAPQALNYFLHLVIVGICLRWLRSNTTLTFAPLKRRRLWERAAALFRRLFPQAALRESSETTSRPLRRAGLLLIVVLLFAAIASSHQLTPSMTILALTALVVFQRSDARGLPLLTLIVAVLWSTFMATAFMRKEWADLLASFGQVENNLDLSLHELGALSPTQQVVALMARSLTLAVWSLAFLGGLQRLRAGYIDFSVIILAGAAFVALGGNSYGGEILFRIYLFSLPAMVFFAAALLYPTPAAGRSRRAAVASIALSGALLAGFLFAYYGKEQQYHFTPQEVEASEYLYETAPPNSLLIEGARNYPSQFRNYERFTYVPIANEAPEERLKIIRQPAAVLERWMSNDRYAASYLIITRSQKVMNEALGVMPAGALDQIEQALQTSGRFRILYGNTDARIYILAEQAAGATR